MGGLRNARALTSARHYLEMSPATERAHAWADVSRGVCGGRAGGPAPCPRAHLAGHPALVCVCMHAGRLVRVCMHTGCLVRVCMHAGRLSAGPCPACPPINPCPHCTLAALPLPGHHLPACELRSLAWAGLVPSTLGSGAGDWTQTRTWHGRQLGQAGTRTHSRTR